MSKNISNGVNLKKLFNPKSVAIVGASSEEGKVGNVIAKNILNLGYEGEVFLVNPKHSEILGKKCYKSLMEIEKEIDLAIIAIPAKFVASEIEKNADRIHPMEYAASRRVAKPLFHGVKNFVIISAGFSEIGEEGKKREEELKKLAEEKKLNILGPNCLGFIVPKIKLNASFAGGMPEAGNISFVSQSGALAVALMDAAKKENMKFSNIISIGNKMQLDESEILEFLADDEDTQVIGMYLESIKDGKKFMETAQKVSKIKPIIILKAGRDEKTQKAITSHTGALAGDDAVISAALEKSGTIRVGDWEGFFNLLNLFNGAKNIIGKKAVVITNAGGLGVLLADAFDGKNIQLAELDEKTKEELRDCLPAESSVENPIDLLGDAHEDRYEKVLEIISKVSEIGMIICALTPQDQTPVEKIAEVVVDFKNKTDKIIVAVFLGGEKVKIAKNKFKENNIGSFDFPDLAVEALNDLCGRSDFRQNMEKNKKISINEKRQIKIAKIINNAKADGRQALYYSEAAEVLEMYGIKTLPVAEVNLENNFKKISYPAALKVDSDKVLHKTDQKALILDIKNEDELNKAISDIKYRFPKDRIIIQPMAEKGAEIIIGIKQDKNFGPVIIYGLGGIYAEVFKMVDYLMPPESFAEIKKSLTSGKLKFLFQETRGQKEYNLEEIAGIISGICQMAMEVSEISEFDINPLIIYNNGKKVALADIKILI